MFFITNYLSFKTCLHLKYIQNCYSLAFTIDYYFLNVLVKQCNTSLNKYVLKFI